MKRRTAGFLELEDELLIAYSTEGTPGNDSLARVVPEVPVGSVSTAIRALVLAGHRALEAERLGRSYDAAVEAGELDAESEAWYRAVATTLSEIWESE